MLRKRLIICVSLIIALVCVCSLTGYPLKRAQAATVTNHWTWSFPEDGLTYEVYEYSDCRFTVTESCGGAMRLIIGHPYLTYAGDPRASVDTTTAAYWAQVANNCHWEAIKEAVTAIIGWSSVVVETTYVGAAHAAIQIIAGTAIGDVISSRESHTLTPSDETKVFYEIAVCNRAACDLAATPGITIPTESVWSNS